MEGFSKTNLVLWPIHGSNGVSRGLEDGSGYYSQEDTAIDTSTAKGVRPVGIHSFFAIV
jgi:hypothetical protein